MTKKSGQSKVAADKLVKSIRRKTRQTYSSEEKICIVLAGLRGEESISAPFHPQTQGKIERWHQTMKNRVLLENYYLPGDLEQQIGAFVEYYNNERYHESLNNVTPADVYFGRDKSIIRERKKIKRNTINQRRLQHFKKAA